MRKLFVTLFITVQTLSFANNPKDTLFVTEPFAFEVKGNLKLEGTLTLPEKFTDCTKIAILAAPPVSAEKDYGGLFLSLAEHLGKRGIATLRFNNRAFTDSTSAEANEMITMYDHADDLHNAFLALKKNKRFLNNPIGLIGHSEGGSSSIIEASRNKDINFLITLSTCGIDGADFCYWQSTLYFSYPNMYPTNVRNHLVRDIYERTQIVKSLNGSAEINAALRCQIKESAARAGVEYTDEQIEKNLKQWTIPRIIAFIKYTPEKYLSQISCPVFAAHGMTDGNLEWKTNLDGIEQAFIKSGKSNYRIVAFQDTNHSYQNSQMTIPFFISLSHKKEHKPVFIEKNWDMIADWLINNH